MKVALLILLLISIGIIKSFDINSIEDSHWESDEGFEYHKCWKNLTGYYTEFALSSYNTMFPTPYGVIPVSFYEGGVVTTDIKGKQMYVHYGVVAQNLTTWGQFYAYGKNQTQYVVSNTSCIAMKLQFPFPEKLPKFKKVGSTKIGQVDVDVWIVKGKQQCNVTKSCILIQKDSCIPMSANFGNKDKSNLGFSLLNYYRYENTPHYDKFQLPSQCWGIKPKDNEDDKQNKNKAVNSLFVNEVEQEEHFGDNQQAPSMRIAKNNPYYQQPPQLKNVKNNKHHKQQETQDPDLIKTTTKTSTKTTSYSRAIDSPSQHHSNVPKSINFHHLF
ncbi:hypothetical protein RB653_005376 [Dictyostelium firmibasis]|uniref:Uncharacterized protein n=1 Tax=Dictyostelium firmibasis TaxID=79012 RepID=A0AAN7YZ68_9MYCE